MTIGNSPMQGSPPSVSSVQAQADNCKITRTQPDDSKAPCNGDNASEIINGLQEQIVELEKLVKRQKRTITNQSRAISDPRVHRPMMYPLTPQHPGPSMVATPYQTPHSGFSQSEYSLCGQSEISQSSSIYDHPPPPFGPLVNNSRSARLGAAHRDAPATSDPFGPSAQAMLNAPSVTDPREMCKCPHMCEFFDADVAISELSTRFRDLWHHVENWAYTHANIPLIRKDSNLEPQTKEYIMALADRSQASALLGATSTRHSLVAKAINFYLVHEIFKVNIARAFDAVASQEISEIQRQLAADTTFIVRQLAVLAMMARTKNVLELPGFGAFYEAKCNMHVAKLWQYAGPLSHDPSETYKQAWQELSNIVGEAQLLATDMYLAPFEYNFEFPGLNEPFDPTTMINHDIYIRGNPQGLKNNDFRVRLGVTPITRIRNISVSPADVKLVCWAGVLLRSAPKVE